METGFNTNLNDNSAWELDSRIDTLLRQHADIRVGTLMQLWDFVSTSESILTDPDAGGRSMSLLETTNILSTDGDAQGPAVSVADVVVYQ